MLHEAGVAFYDKGLYDKALKFFAQAQTHRLTPRFYAMGLAHEAKQDGGGHAAIARLCNASPTAYRFVRRADALASVGEIVEAAQLETVLSVDRTNTRLR